MFHLPADLGRRYSALAGDYNPIHLSALTARPFGFKRAIIHGMWTLARASAKWPMICRPSRAGCDVRFERPVFLPSRVHLAVTRDGPGALAFTLTSPDLRTRHFSGVVVHEPAREAAPGAGE
jgi:acyl dehydratase